MSAIAEALVIVGLIGSGIIAAGAIVVAVSSALDLWRRVSGRPGRGRAR